MALGFYLLFLAIWTQCILYHMAFALLLPPHLQHQDTANCYCLILIFLYVARNTTVHSGNILFMCPFLFTVLPTGLDIMGGAKWWDWAFPNPDKLSRGEMAAYGTAFIFLILVFLGSSLICIYNTLRSPRRAWAHQQSWLHRNKPLKMVTTEMFSILSLILCC